MENAMTDYESRLTIPLIGGNSDPCRFFFTRSGILVAEGYSRVVIGSRGPYVEFHSSNMRQAALCETDIEHYYYVELRTLPDRVKVYCQVHPVDYADYVPGMYYISPFELFSPKDQLIISPLNNT
jgi:hypothetical protein